MSRAALERVALELKRDIVCEVARRCHQKVDNQSLMALTLDTPYSAIVRHPLRTALPKLYLGRLFTWIKKRIRFE